MIDMVFMARFQAMIDMVVMARFQAMIDMVLMARFQAMIDIVFMENNKTNAIAKLMFYLPLCGEAPAKSLERHKLVKPQRGVVSPFLSCIYSVELFMHCKRKEDLFMI